MTGRILWHLALIAAGAAYLLLVLFGGIEIPLFGACFVLLAGFEVIKAHRGESGRRPSDTIEEKFRVRSAPQKWLRQ
jgi:hypothetical protein